MTGPGDQDPGPVTPQSNPATTRENSQSEVERGDAGLPPTWTAAAWDSLRARLHDANDHHQCPNPGVIISWMIDAENLARCTQLRCPACHAEPGNPCYDPHGGLLLTPHPARRYRAARD